LTAIVPEETQKLIFQVMDAASKPEPSRSNGRPF
jgi:hypothetical protein